MAVMLQLQSLICLPGLAIKGNSCGIAVPFRKLKRVNGKKTLENMECFLLSNTPEARKLVKKNLQGKSSLNFVPFS
jgi:hypothetical protein